VQAPLRVTACRDRRACVRGHPGRPVRATGPHGHRVAVPSPSISITPACDAAVKTFSVATRSAVPPAPADTSVCCTRARGTKISVRHHHAALDEQAVGEQGEAQASRVGPRVPCERPARQRRPMTTSGTSASRPVPTRAVVATRPRWPARPGPARTRGAARPGGPRTCAPWQRRPCQGLIVRVPPMPLHQPPGPPRAW